MCGVGWAEAHYHLKRHAPKLVAVNRAVFDKVKRVFLLFLLLGFPVAQMVEHGASNAKIMGSIPRESKSW